VEDGSSAGRKKVLRVREESAALGGCPNRKKPPRVHQTELQVTTKHGKEERNECKVDQRKAAFDV